jgi:hypothetical protein
MSTEDLLKICKDYGVSVEEFRHAAIAEMLLSDDTMKKGVDLENWVAKVQSVLDTEEMISAIKWASWVKHAKQTGEKGQTVEELLALRKAS